MSEPQHAGNRPDAPSSEAGSTPPPLPPVAQPRMAPPPLPRAAAPLPPARPASNSVLKTLLIIVGFVIFAIGSLAVGVLAWWIWNRG